jgi:hypothetical protein
VEAKQLDDGIGDTLVAVGCFWGHNHASKLSKERTPAILAMKRGDAPAIRFIITAAPILFPPFAVVESSECESDRFTIAA